ncbi:APC family permease [Puerhibacterium puerhi]|uniref:APC family permease n=1 Tax=Puerhibacterium puerhi TaxID=2692623 RepID=UPI0013582CC2|nr:APC family permease [Puerhibacterium puerhi]
MSAPVAPVPSPASPAAAAPAPAGARTLAGTLGPTAIVFMVVAAASPLTVVGGAAPLGILLGNGAGYPALYVAAGVVLLLFSVGLATMTRSVPRPGAFFTYVGYGLGRRPGLAAAFLALLSYTTVQVAVYGYLGYVLATTFAGLGVTLPWWLWTLLVVACVGLLGYRHIDLSSKVLGVLLVAEIAIVLAVVAGVLVTGGADGLSLTPFEPATVMSGSPAIGLMMAIAAFIGFESTAIFRDEARDPDRTIPRATYAAVVGVAVFYTVATWGIVMAWGPDEVVDVAAQDPGAMLMVTTAKYLGTAGQVIVNVLLVTSMFACVLSFHNVVARYQHSMAHAGVLPGRLGRVHARHASPHTSSLVQTATAAVLTAVFAALGWDPMLQVFTWLSGVSTIAIAVLMAVTSLAVIVWFTRHRDDTRAWNTRVAPALGLVGLLAAAAAIVANFPLLVSDVDAAGNPTFGAVSLVLLGLVVVFPLVGWVQAEVLRRRRPASYQRIADAIS